MVLFKQLFKYTLYLRYGCVVDFLIYLVTWCLVQVIDKKDP